MPLRLADDAELEAKNDLLEKSADERKVAEGVCTTPVGIDQVLHTDVHVLGAGGYRTRGKASIVASADGRNERTVSQLWRGDRVQSGLVAVARLQVLQARRRSNRSRHAKPRSH